jgi:hypothetical protein
MKSDDFSPMPVPASGSDCSTATSAMFALPIVLKVVTGDNVPSFKNRKRSILDSATGQQRTLTPKKIKERMALLQGRIESVLYSLYQTGERETDLACRKQLRTALSGLSDDSLVEMPEFSFGVRYVEKGFEGVEITIEWKT